MDGLVVGESMCKRPPSRNKASGDRPTEGRADFVEGEHPEGLLFLADDNIESF